MQEFKFEIISETENAFLANVPYFEQTSENVKKHKQLFYKCWIPKSVIHKGIAKDFVIRKRNELRMLNSYQRKQKMPSSWLTLGEYAPLKSSHKLTVIDYDKLAELINSYQTKYGKSLRSLINDEMGVNGPIDDNELKVLNNLMFPSLEKEGVPKKQIIIYK